MLQNARATAFTVSELLKENQQEGKITPHSIQIRVKEKGLFPSKTYFYSETKSKVDFEQEESNPRQ